MFTNGMMRLSSFVLAWLIMVIIGTSICSLFVLNELSLLGVVLPLDVRLQTIGHDIIGMAPLFGIIFGLAILAAFIVAFLVTHYLISLPRTVYTSAGFIAVMAAIMIMEAVFQLSGIAATRTFGGILSLSLVGGLSGFVYIWLREKSSAKA